MFHFGSVGGIIFQSEIAQAGRSVDFYKQASKIRLVAQKRTVLYDSLRHGNLGGACVAPPPRIQAAFHAAVHCVHITTHGVGKGNL